MTYRIQTEALNAIVVGILFGSTIGLSASTTVWAILAFFNVAQVPLWTVTGTVAAVFVLLSVRFGINAWRVEMAGTRSNTSPSAPNSETHDVTFGEGLSRSP